MTDTTLLARLRRYLPYLGIYAADVREAIWEIERLNRREAAAREILEPLRECDPKVREWLGGVAAKQ